MTAKKGPFWLIGRIALAMAGLGVGCWFTWTSCIAPFERGDALYGATLDSDYVGMKSRLSSGTHPDWLFDGSSSSLEAAVQNDDPKAAAILLNYGADTNLMQGHEQNLLSAPKFAKRVSAERARIENKPPE